MTNWQKFKIINVSGEHHWSINNCILFGTGTERLIDYSDGKRWFVCCANSYPYNTWQAGDYLEIDLDKVRNYKSDYHFDDPNIVRKVGSSSSLVPYSSSSTGMTIGSTTITREHSLAVARELDAMVEQSGGRNEYTAHIEVYDNQGRPIKFSLSSKRSK